MKYIITLLQVIWWIIADSILFLLTLKWNQYLYKCGHSFKKNKYGYLSYINNHERMNYIPNYDNKYKAAFKLN